MIDRDLSALHVIAAALWFAGLTIVVLDLAGVARAAPLGLFCAGAAMTCNVRGFLCHMEGRARRAFDLGRDLGRREHSEATPLRR